MSFLSIVNVVLIGEMMEELKERLKKLRLSTEEEVVLNFSTGDSEDVQQKGQRSLIVKVCVERAVGKEIVANAMEKIWRISKRVEF